MRDSTDKYKDGLKIKKNSRPKDIYWEELKISYMHVNKAASNSLNHALQHVLGPETAAQHAAGIKEKKWLIFAFVREPWDRFISAYTHNVIQGKMTGPQKARGFTREMTLREYAEKIIAMPVEDHDKHFVPQFHRLSNDHGQLVPNWIGRIENMTEDWSTLCDLFAERVGHKCWQPLNWMKRRYHYRQRIPVAERYDEETKKMVMELYAKDYETWYPPDLVA